MSSRSFMNMYWGDYLRDTMRLSTEEHGAYLLLIAEYWVKGEPLPDDDAVLSKIVRISPKKWKKIKINVECFFEKKDGNLVHVRIEEELSKALKKHIKRVEAGRLGGKQSSSNAKANTTAMPKHLPEPEPYKEKETNKEKISIDDQKVKRASQIRDDWKPSEKTKTKLNELLKGLDVKPDYQISIFIEYWQGEGKPMKDWDAVFMSRIRRWKEAGKFPQQKSDTGWTTP